MNEKLHILTAEKVTEIQSFGSSLPRAWRAAEQATGRAVRRLVRRRVDRMIRRSAGENVVRAGAVGRHLTLIRQGWITCTWPTCYAGARLWPPRFERTPR